MLAESASDAGGLHAIQACATEAASENGHSRLKFVTTVGAGMGRKTSLATTPKWPVPAPRSAQNRSASWYSSQSTTRPLASTTRAPTRRSEVTPCVRPRNPRPPPSVRPAIPTDGQVPPAIVMPSRIASA